MSAAPEIAPDRPVPPGVDALGDAIDPALDARTLAIGRDLFAAARKAPPGEGWLDRRLMAIAMGDDRVKAQLFRLVDVLPVLKTPTQVNRHLKEYLGGVRDHLPWPARAGLKLVPGGDGLLGRMASGATLWGTRRMARRFIAAADPREAIAAVRKLRAQGLTFTIDVLGEAVLAASEADAYQRFYLELIDALATDAASWHEDPILDRDDRGPIPKVNVSVKLSSLFSQFDPIDPAGTSRAVRERLRPILRLAKSRGVLINVDMEQYAFKDATIQIFRDVLEEDEFRTWPDVGIAIQAYLKDTQDDFRALAEWARSRGAPVWVRLVKGAYRDYENVVAQQNDWPIPVWPTKPETDANYEACTQLLLEHAAHLRPAIASHNIRSIAFALAYAERLNLAPGAVEFQLLYGMADPIKTALKQLGRCVRVYAPVGQLLPGMAYLVRRLLENTSNESFLRAGFLENVPEEKLLMNPLNLIRRNGKRDVRESTRMITNENGNVAPGDPIRDDSWSFVKNPFRNEPLSDFARQAARDEMKATLDRVAGEFGRSYPLVIAGQRVETGQWIDSIDPSKPDRIVGRAASARVEDSTAAIAAAKREFESWRDVPAEERATLILRVAEILRRDRFALAALAVYETGKPWREADADVAEAIDFCEYYAREAVKLSHGWHRTVPGEDNLNLYEPRGVTVVIAPWNFPLAILTGMTVAAVVTGNTAVMKPAEQSSVIAAKLMSAFEEAGLPAGVVNYLPGVGETVGPPLVASPDVATIVFTGSRAVGLAITEQASKTPPGQTHVKRVITEMGGKNAVIVDEDADLDEAVAGVLGAAFGYAGQKCSACSRAIVHTAIYDTFVARLSEAAASLTVGPADDPSVTYGPVIDREAYDRIRAAIALARSEGLTLTHPVEGSAVGGGQSAVNSIGVRTPMPDDGQMTMDNGREAADPRPHAGYFIRPHIFRDVPPTSFLAQDEIFGPVLAVIRADSLDHALSIANGTAYALTGGLYSRSPAAIDTVRRQFRVGNLYVNRKCTGALVDRQPFGGYHLSGVGSKAGGPDYLLQFTWPRTITENTMRRGFAPDLTTPVDPSPGAGE
ncbi:MAG TPA: proline dehydrogenase family protein [Tepidisphaeraceae bacterium]|nr:proline dehydrogenase family protein [Tepidisphaeraceae bacterium]